ncbi:unnamed protein product [Prunus armeniaca]
MDTMGRLMITTATFFTLCIIITIIRAEFQYLTVPYHAPELCMSSQSESHFLRNHTEDEWESCIIELSNSARYVLARTRHTYEVILFAVVLYRFDFGWIDRIERGNLFFLQAAVDVVQ